jgi:sugar lactone lactonase YvrE
MSELREYATGMRWGEGPRWHKGALWLSDTQGSRLWTDVSGSWTPTETPLVPNGLWFLPDGRLVGALTFEGRLAVWTGSDWSTYADLGHLGVGPLGDMVGDSAGNLYVDDVAFNAAAGEPPRPGRIILVRPDGTAEVATEQVEFPNGMALVDTGRMLVVAETARQRLIAFAVDDDGLLGEPQPYADVAALLGPAARPDGIWPAADGGVWVATTSGCRVVHLRRDQLVQALDTTPEMPIACCLDGSGDLLITLADTHGRSLVEAITTKTVRTRVVRARL